jgi:very-short-patch-repair endonuclease
MCAQSAAPDVEVALVAARQHGVVTFAQLRQAGLSHETIRRRVTAGHLHRLHRGIYAVGYRNSSPASRWMGSVLACCGHGGTEAGDAFLSHRSAAALWRLLPARNGPVDVAIVGEAGRTGQMGIRIHRPRTLEHGMTTRLDGIPVTDPQRTISDLRRAKPSRGGANPKELRRAMRQAAVFGLPIGPDTRPERTRSDLERLFKRIRRRSGIPAPEVNVKVDGLEVDFLWRDRRLIIETDGYRYHRGRIAFEDDRDRDLTLRALGYTVIRLSDTQLEEEAEKVASIVRRLLAAD